ncbi:hypothetical protein EVAR_89446_1 [Eumeta japonica]|uniref:Uncharacterized protein n=1 Tax=Eumeta variegata TaxID=151549 RepID=A0A4C1Z624_EUMVA|nr:hypothetical protein EVAR_89446_1 [Eumeta japonica]
MESKLFPRKINKNATLGARVLGIIKYLFCLLQGLIAVQALPSGSDSVVKSGKAWKKAKASQLNQASQSESSSSTKETVGGETIEKDVKEEDASSKSKKASEVSTGSKRKIATDHGEVTESVKQSSKSFESESSESKKKITKVRDVKAKPDGEDQCDEGASPRSSAGDGKASKARKRGARRSDFGEDVDTSAFRRKDSFFDDRDDFGKSDDDFSTRSRRRSVDDKFGNSDEDDLLKRGRGGSGKSPRQPSPGGSQTEVDGLDGRTQSQTIESLSIPGEENHFKGKLTQTQTMGKNGRSQLQGAATNETYDQSADGKTKSYTRLDQEGKSDKYGQTQSQMLRNEEETVEPDGCKKTKNMLAQTQTETPDGESESQSAMTETSSYSETVS